PAGAGNPADYTITWLGPDGLAGTSDDEVIPVHAGTAGGQPVVYNPGANVDVASGKTYPTAVRQTVTLLFAGALPAGSYQVELSASIQTAPFNASEVGLLSSAASFTGHAVVSVVRGTVTEGDRRTATDLVFAGGALGDLSVWQRGTPFLTQLHDDLSALLDARLTALGDDPSIPDAIDHQIVARFDPALGPPAVRPVAGLVIWLDPVPVGLFGSSNNRAVYNLRDNSFVNTFTNSFVMVAGNVEVLALAFVPTGVQNFLLTVETVPGARGGVIYFGVLGNQIVQLTAALREGTTRFLLSFGDPVSQGERSSSLGVALLRTLGDGAPPPAGPVASIPASHVSNPVLIVILSELEALASLRTSRSERASVLSITPLAGVPGGAEGAAGPSRGAGESGGGGEADAVVAAEDPLVREMRDLLAELGRMLPEVAGRLRVWLQDLGIWLPV